MRRRESIRLIAVGLPACALAVALGLAPVAWGAELAKFEVREPLGQTWTEEWLTHEATVDLAGREIKGEHLELLTRDGEDVPHQFYSASSGGLVADDETLSGSVKLKILFKATVRAKESLAFVIRDEGKLPRQWPEVKVRSRGTKTTIANGVYEVGLDTSLPLPLNEMRCGSVPESLGAFAWPKEACPTGVSDVWLEKGPARALLKRVFNFAHPAHHYEVLLDFRSGDPWLDVADSYALGGGSAIEIDLGPLNADTVYHSHTYNARTFGTGGSEEDSTLEPPQHPIATLGPVWRDIWFGGGPFGFVYGSGADHGVGFAAVRGSEWDAPEGISLESQNIEIHGDRDEPGRVLVRIPTDGGRRRWAIILGAPGIRKRLGRLVRSHADIPLDMVLKEWILEWESNAPEVSAGTAGLYLGGYFNQHFFNPTTLPRRVRAEIDRHFQRGEVKSPGLGVLGYVFTNPNYWPGPKYKWKIGNPNFHTDMYSIPLRIGLLMPDHPHAKKWLDYGIEETKGNLMRDSYPGGAWQESLSYSGYFFHVVENARLLRDAGVLNPFKEWPRFKEVATYLACMHTPVDPRYAQRQIAPIGDTSPGDYIKQLRAMASLYGAMDDRFAEQLARFPGKWDEALDIGSREFFGFGAMLRGSPYDERHESFVAVKAGPARNHFQGDELSFYFAGLGTPLAIDYACHYSPRPWSASIHNRPDMQGKRPVAVAVRRAMVTSDAADVFVADERATRINHVPMEPHKATKPGWEYPTTVLPEDRAWTMRRYAMLVKHSPAKSEIPDWLVIRDEVSSPEPAWWNLHMLARAIEDSGPSFRFPGQLDVDVTVHFLTPVLEEIEKREWGWSGRDADGRRNLKGEEYEKRFFGAYIPRNFEKGTWANRGEMAEWLRVKAPAGRSDWLVVLMPNLQSEPAAKVEKLSDTSARITLGEESEIVHLGSDGQFQAAVERSGRLTILLKAGEVKAWSQLDFVPSPAR